MLFRRDNHLFVLKDTIMVVLQNEFYEGVINIYVELRVKMIGFFLQYATINLS